VRIPRDLNKKDGLLYLVSSIPHVLLQVWNFVQQHLYYRRTRRRDIPLITDIQLLPKNAEPTNSDREKWNKVEHSVRDGVVGLPPLYLWFKLGPSLQELDDSDKKKLVTELDVLYGKDRTWYGFEKVDAAINEGEGGKVDPVWLTLRRGVKGSSHEYAVTF
jgi:hypothetical protein